MNAPVVADATIGKQRKSLRAVYVALAAIVLGLGLWLTLRRGPQPPRYETTTVDKGRIVAKVTATGTLSALVTVQVGSQVSGRIAELHADFNTPVKKGELIAKIDPQLYEAAVENARANHTGAVGALAQAKAKAVDARRIAKRNRELFQKSLIAEADVLTSEANADALEAAVQMAQGQLDQAKAQLHQAELNLAYTRIVSPINGVVISRAVDVGQTVAASLQAPTLFTIAEDLRKMQVDSSVAEADVGKLKDGMKAFFTVDAYPNDRFVGTIRQIRNAPTTTQNVVTYDAVIDVDNSDLRLKPGMTANVTVIYAERDDVLRFANAALRWHPTMGDGDGKDKDKRERGKRNADPSLRTVWVLRGEKPEAVQVHTGLTDGTMTEIVDGALQDGDRLVTDMVSGKGGPGGQGGPPRGFRMF